MTKSNPGDVYNPTHPTFGNTYLQETFKTTCPSTSDGNTLMVDWVYMDSSKYDLRMTMLKCSVVGGQAQFSQKITWGTCNIQQISPMTGLPVCFTTEACKYAQTGYFLGMVWGQILNFFVCKTRKLSVITQGVSNSFMYFSFVTEIMLVLAVTYFLPFNVAFGLRDNIFMHYGVSALPFSMLQLVVD
jgi:magnesium-transporting ATPase (P-type)